MSKCQEALNKIVKSCCPNCSTNGCKDCSIEKICNATAKQWVDTIQELVDKATPKKPIRFKNSVYISNPKCPICKTTPHTGNQKYCDECGQALDWSDEKPRDLELEVYEELCIGCSDEKICHEECEHCVQFYERLKEKENE